MPEQVHEFNIARFHIKIKLVSKKKTKKSFPMVNEADAYVTANHGNAGKRYGSLTGAVREKGLRRGPTEKEGATVSDRKTGPASPSRSGRNVTQDKTYQSPRKGRKGRPECSGGRILSRRTVSCRIYGRERTNFCGVSRSEFCRKGEFRHLSSGHRRNPPPETYMDQPDP